MTKGQRAIVAALKLPLWCPEPDAPDNPLGIDSTALSLIWSKLHLVCLRDGRVVCTVIFTPDEVRNHIKDMQAHLDVMEQNAMLVHRDGSGYWKDHWNTLKDAEPNTASGRSSYGPSHVRILVLDATTALDLQPEDSLIDIGCAAGLMGEVLIPMVKSYVGVDYSEVSLQSFRDRLPAAEVVNAGATKLPYGNGEFSKSLMSSVLLCLSKEEAFEALREMRRVTTVRGFCSGNLIGEQPDPSCCEDGCLCYAHCCWFEPGELEELAIKAGWKSAKTVAISKELQHSTIM